MLSTIIGGTLIGVGGSIIMVAVAEAIVRRRNRLPRQTESDRIFDAMMAAELAKFEAIHADYEAVQGMRQILGGGIINMLEGTFAPAWAKPELTMGGEYAPDYRIFPVVRGDA